MKMQEEGNRFKSKPVDEMGVIDRVQRIKARSIKAESKVEGLKLVLSMIDLTTLEGADSTKKIEQLCYKAMHPMDGMEGLPTAAAVCVYPTLVKTAKRALQGSDVKVAAVSTYFPSGQAPLKAKLEETKRAIEEGADEIDMVIARGKFLAGQYDQVLDEVKVIKKVCEERKVRLKVILETGELGTLENVRRAADLVLQAEPDFIKTSTGKIGSAANMPVTLVMLDAIWDHFRATGNRVGMKPAGGISDAKSALLYLRMVHEVLGEPWLTKQWFRFGASRLMNDVLMQLKRQEEGVYQSSDYFTKD